MSDIFRCAAALLSDDVSMTFHPVTNSDSRQNNRISERVHSEWCSNPAFVEINRIWESSS